ncbi:MAG: hypothetical protein ACOX63_10135 [Christensenellales bacterium]|jgi:hypothetical protein
MTKDEIDAAIASISEGIEVLEAIGEQHAQLPDGQLTRLQTDRIALAALREARDRMEGCKYCTKHNNIPDAVWDACDFMYVESYNEYIFNDMKFCPWCGRQMEGGAQA